MDLLILCDACSQTYSQREEGADFGHVHGILGGATFSVLPQPSRRNDLQSASDNSPRELRDYSLETAAREGELFILPYAMALVFSIDRFIIAS